MSGNNLTMLTYGIYAIDIEDFSGGDWVNAEVTIEATWTVAYNAKLKAGASGSVVGSGKNFGGSSGASFNVAINYTYTSSNSSSTSFYCNVTPTSL